MTTAPATAHGSPLADRLASVSRGIARLLLIALCAQTPATAVAAASAASADAVTAILAGHLVDTESGRELDAQTILIQGGITTAVGPAIEIPAGARVIDLRAYTVLPGLIDAHTHLTIDATSQDPLGELEHTAAERAFGSIPNARAVLSAGFTTVRDLVPIERWWTSPCATPSTAATSSDRACTLPGPTSRSRAAQVP